MWGIRSKATPVDNLIKWPYVNNLKIANKPVAHGSISSDDYFANFLGSEPLTTQYQAISILQPKTYKEEKYDEEANVGQPFIVRA